MEPTHHGVMKAYRDLKKHVATREELQQRGWSNQKISCLMKTGEVIAVRAGVYCWASDFNKMPWWNQHCIEIIALNRKLNHPVFGFESAAALWDLPLLTKPEKLHLYVPTKSHHSLKGVSRHSGLDHQLPVANPVPGFTSTAVSKTVLDCVKTMPFKNAVVLADAALHNSLLTVAELTEALEQSSSRGSARVKRVLSAVSHLSESAGESLTRILLDELGVRYEEQVEFAVAGCRFRVDFFLPDYGIIVEFDGKTKYLDFQPTNEVLIQERNREKGLTNLGFRFYRVGFDDVSGSGDSFKQGLLRLIGMVSRARESGG